MLSGDKADSLPLKCNNSQSLTGDIENSQDSSKKTYYQKLSSKSSKDVNEIDCNYTDVSENCSKGSNDVIVKQLDIETVKTQDLIRDTELKTNELLMKLNTLRTQNLNLENLIESSLKENLTMTDYCSNFDNYVSQASSILTKLFKKFSTKLRKSLETQSVVENAVVKVTTSSLIGNSFMSYLKINKIQDLVQGMSAIGHGGEGRVYRANLISSGEPVVVKSYFMDCEQSSRIEYAMLVLCNNVRGVKKPIGLFQTVNNYYLIMEDDHKSIPLDVLAEKGILTENQIQHLFSQMVYILYDLRNKFIKHRDVKLDNFLLNTESGRLSIIDFGWAMYTALDQVLIEEVKRSGETLMGTFDYLPPEADSCAGTIVSYDKATVFALGCILLELFFGYQGKVRNILAKETLHGFIDRVCGSTTRLISKGAISILDRCLRITPKERLSLDEVLLHPWVPSDKVDNSLFRNINKVNTNCAQSTNTSLPCNLSRQHSQ